MDLAPFPKKHLMELISFNFFYIYCGRNGNAERREISQEDFRIDLLLISSDARDWIMPQIEFFSAWIFFSGNIWGVKVSEEEAPEENPSNEKGNLYVWSPFLPLPSFSLLNFLLRQANICPRRKPPKNAAATSSDFSFKRKKGETWSHFPAKNAFLKKFCEMKPLLHGNEWEEVQSRMSKASSKKKLRMRNWRLFARKFARLCRRDTGCVITPQLHTHVWKRKEIAQKGEN